MSGWLENVFPNLLIASRDAAVLSLCIGGLLWGFRKRIPSNWHHVIWMIVALRLLLPALPGSAFSWQVLLEKETEKIQVHVQADIPDQVAPQTIRMVEKIPVRVGDAQPLIIPKWKPDFFSIAAMIWSFGFTVCLAAIVILSVRFRRNVSRLTIANHSRTSEVETMLSKLCQELAIVKIPALIVTEAVQGPALTGFWQRKVLLPPSSLDLLDEKQIELVLMHELAHLRRFDLWTGWVLCLLQAVHWFNPLVWWAFHRTRIEAERATDDWVLLQSGEEHRQDYGEMLLTLLETTSSRHRTLPGVVGVLESRRDLHHRLAAIAQFRKHRSRLAVVGAVALMSGLAVVGLTQAPREENPQPKVVSEKVEKSPESSPKQKKSKQAASDLDSLNPFLAPKNDAHPLGETREMIDAFMKAPYWESRLPLIYHGKSLKPTIAEYYKEWPYVRAEKFSLQLFQHEQSKKLDGPYWVYLVSTDSSDAGLPIIVRVENGKLKVDWEIYSEFQDKHFVEFINGNLSSPNSFRVVIEQKAEYSGPDSENFTDIDDYLCFEISPPYGKPAEFSKYAFVKKGTPLAKRLNKDVGVGSHLLAVIVTLDFKKFSHGVKHMVITEWIGEGWFSKTQSSKKKARIVNKGNIGKEQIGSVVSQGHDLNGKKNSKEDSSQEPVQGIPDIQFLLPDGKTPAAGARLFMGTRWPDFRHLATPDPHPEYPPYLCDQAGMLALPETSLTTGWAIHEGGYLQVTKVELKEAKGDHLRLKPYTQISGKLLINGKPARNRTLVFYCNVPGITEKKLRNTWINSVASDAEGRFLVEHLVPAEESYRIYIIDRLTGKRTGYPLGKVKAESNKVNSINLNFDEAGRINVKGRFVTRDGRPLKDVPFQYGSFSYFSQFGNSYSNVDRGLMVDGSFLTVAILPGRYSLRGRFDFNNGERVQFDGLPWFIPADAIQKAKNGIYDIGDIPIEYPKIISSQGKAKIPGRETIRVVDEKTGKPIEGATIVPTTLGMASGITFFWRKGAEKIDPKSEVTNKDGFAEIRFPIKLTQEGSDAYGDPTITDLYVSVAHPEYPTRKARVSVENAADEVSMQKGSSLIIVPKREDGGPIYENGMTIQITGLKREIPSSEWKWETNLDSTRSMANRRIPPGEHLVRCILRDKAGDFFYSDAEPQRFESGEEIVLPVTLKRGLPFTGMLDKNVPRPVKEGWITVTVLPDDDSLERLYGNLAWFDTVELNENGSFKFSELPPGKVFIHAGCKGWAHVVNTTRRYSNEQGVDSEERKNAIIEMNASGSCRFTVLKPDGSPLSGAKISMFPRQRIYKVMDKSFGSMGYAVINKNREEKSENKDEPGIERSANLTTKLARKWKAITDENGVATIENIPYGEPRFTRIHHPHYGVPLNRHQQRNLYSEVVNGKTVEITVKMEKNP